MPAEGILERGEAPRAVRVRETDAALEELAVGVDERDQGDWRLEHGRGEAGEAVERLFRWAVEQSGAAERLEAGRVLNGDHGGEGEMGPETRCATS
jgi:hypothetical protein